MFAPFDRDCKPSSRSARVVGGVIGDLLRPRKQTEKGTRRVIGVLLQAFAKGMLRGRFGQMTALPIPVTHELISVFVNSCQGTTDSISCFTREPTTFFLAFLIFFLNLFLKFGRTSGS